MLIKGQLSKPAALQLKSTAKIDMISQCQKALCKKIKIFDLIKGDFFIALIYNINI